MKRKLLSKTTCWKYNDKTVIHTVTEPQDQPIYFSNGSTKPFEWDKGGYIDLEKTPKPHFIKRYLKKLLKLN